MWSRPARCTLFSSFEATPRRCSSPTPALLAGRLVEPGQMDSRRVEKKTKSNLEKVAWENYCIGRNIESSGGEKRKKEKMGWKLEHTKKKKLKKTKARKTRQGKVRECWWTKLLPLNTRTGNGQEQKQKCYCCCCQVVVVVVGGRFVDARRKVVMRPSAGAPP